MLSIDSAPARSLLFFVVDSVCLYVCNALSILQIDSSSLFLDGIEPLLGHQFSMTKATKRCSSNFDLLPWQRNLGYFCKNFKLLLLFCLSMESSHFLAINSPWAPLQNVVLRFLICCHGNEIWAIFAKKIKLLLLFCFPMESSHFWAVSSPWAPLQNVVLWFLI